MLWFDDAFSLLQNTKAPNSHLLGVKPLNRPARAILVGGFYPVAAATRDNGVAWHAQSMAWDAGPSNRNL